MAAIAPPTNLESEGSKCRIELKIGLPERRLRCQSNGKRGRLVLRHRGHFDLRPQWLTKRRLNG
jgi:hypothetical protein